MNPSDSGDGADRQDRQDSGEDGGDPPFGDDQGGSWDPGANNGDSEADKGDPWDTETDRGNHPGYAVAGAVGAAIGGIVAAFLVTSVTGLGISLLGVSIPTVSQFGIIFIAGAVGLAGTGVSYLAIRGLEVRSYVRMRVPSLSDVGWAVGGYFTALSLIFLAGLVLTMLQVRPETTNRAAQAGMENPELLLWMVPLSFLVIAPAEEFLFRGVIQGRLREAFTPLVAIPATAAIFATVHFFSLTGGSGARMIVIAILFLPSLVFGYAYERTTNLVVPIFIHGAYNATLVALVYVSMKVIEQGPLPA